jgi:subtilisin family serine protease
MNKKIIIYFLIIFAMPFSVGASNGIYQSTLVPSDKYYQNQWYLPRVHSGNAWYKTFSKREAVIAIIDSGVQLDHPDLRENIWVNSGEVAGNGLDDDGNGYIDDVNGWDFVTNTNNPSPKIVDGFLEEEISHGTVIAGIAAARGNNQEGVAGLSWDAKIMPLLVLDAKGAGEIRAVINAIDYAVNNGADIINLSFVSEAYSAELEAAIRRAYKAGVLVVAAAGNFDGDSRGRDLNVYPVYPICADGYYGENMVIGVSATDALDQKTSFSGYGSRCVDISAPGVSMFSTNLYLPVFRDGNTLLDKYYDGYWSGTSMAAALVSGAAALIIANNPALDRKNLVDILLGSADYLEKLNPQYQGALGAGRLNIGRAVDMAQERLRSKTVKIINSPYSGNDSKISITEVDGSGKNEIDVLGEFFGGVNTAAGYLDSSLKKYIVAGGGQGAGPQVQIFSLDGKLVSQFFAYNQNFRGGVSVAVGDVNGDGIEDIITGAGQGGGPHVRIFNINGELLGQFFAYHENFRGGVNVAVGDVNGDGLADIVTGAGAGGGPQVRIFTKSGGLLGQFFAYSESFRGGVNVATADIDGGLRKRWEIITAPASLGAPHVRVFSHLGRLQSEFFAYGSKYRGRISVSAGDINKDGLDEIVTGAGAGGSAHVRSFTADGKLLDAYFAYEEDFLGGVNISVLNY